jgi:hypothetical protein
MLVRLSLNLLQKPKIIGNLVDPMNAFLNARQLTIVLVTCGGSEEPF